MVSIAFHGTSEERKQFSIAMPPIEQEDKKDLGSKHARNIQMHTHTIDTHSQRPVHSLQPT